MPFWSVREVLSQTERLRRSYYELLRDDLDQYMIQYALIDSYSNFTKAKVTYPFVEKRELKPRARIPDLEYEHHNSFLVIFSEDNIPSNHKKYIRFFDVNKTTKTNLLHSKVFPVSSKFARDQKNMDSIHFTNFIKTLLPIDYALLIQSDATSKTKNRYILSHFHVRIDWPITEAAEDMAQRLRYISKDIYEKGEKYAEDIQKKFFEYYGLPVMVGGRRTAAIVAAQYMRKFKHITTIYAGSSESRALIRISERGVSKSILIKFTAKEMDQIAEENNIIPRTFKKNYMIANKGRAGIFILQVTYSSTNHARLPDDGKLREIQPDLNWLTVESQHILPKPHTEKYPPLPINVIYT